MNQAQSKCSPLKPARKVPAPRLPATRRRRISGRDTNGRTHAEANVNEKAEPSPIMKYFDFAHLPEKLQEVSRAVAILATGNGRKLAGRRGKIGWTSKTTRSKDCFVRCKL